MTLTRRRFLRAAGLEHLEFFECRFGRWQDRKAFEELKSILPQVTQFLV